MSCVGVRDPWVSRRWLRGRVWKQDNSQSGGFRDLQGGGAGEERLSQRAERGRQGLRDTHMARGREGDRNTPTCTLLGTPRSLEISR